MSPSPASLEPRGLEFLEKVTETVGPHGAVRFEERLPFGPSLWVERYRLGNGLTVLLCEDHAAPVVAVHTWLRVGSRHEREGKTGLAHLFEHLMFNETEGLRAGEFDRKLEEAGAESNASTWLDWTQYNVTVPKDRFGLVVRLEAERMAHLVLREPQVASEKEVVANERRYRVEDDVEGTANEVLWKTAFTEHAYRWPTIGWMQDIQGFTTRDCADFYQTFYAPNNATLVVVGDVTRRRAIEQIASAYGQMPPAELPIEDVRPEGPQLGERRVTLQKPTATDKLLIGYRSPAFGDADHVALSVLAEVLFGGRASRILKVLVRERELAVDVSGHVGPFRDPGLFEISASARTGHGAAELLDAIDTELDAVTREPVAPREIARAIARFELGLLASLETVDGRAATLGFHETVLGQPTAAFDRLAQARRLTQSDLLRVARRYLRRECRTIVVVQPEAEAADTAGAPPAGARPATAAAGAAPASNAPGVPS